MTDPNEYNNADGTPNLDDINLEYHKAIEKAAIKWKKARVGTMSNVVHFEHFTLSTFSILANILDMLPQPIRDRILDGMVEGTKDAMTEATGALGSLMQDDFDLHNNSPMN